jgi:hypothetical protein
MPTMYSLPEIVGYVCPPRAGEQAHRLDIFCVRGLQVPL